MANFSVFRGDNFTAEITIKDYLNEPANLNGCSVVLSLISAGGTKTAITGVVSDPDTGVVTFELTPTHTDAVGKCRYDVQVTTATSKIYTVDSGTIDIVSDIST